MAVLKAPFPYFGGKSRVAGLVWERLGNPKNYIEPFFGSGAVLLARPSTHFGHEARTETVNDLDGMLANLWRAMKIDPEATAHYADWPVNENDLIARHVWLVGQKESLQTQLEADPEFYDPKIAGWWVWGVSCWIKSSFCSADGPWVLRDGRLVLGDGGRGVNRKLPHLGHGGRGVNRQLPHLGHGGAGVNQQNAKLTDYFARLAERLKNVRVCCGDWSRVCSDSPTIHAGTPVGVFLDPPYGDGRDVYGSDMKHVAAEVAEWAIERGNDARFRIAYCGYEGTVTFPDSWECVPWKATGGFSRVNKAGSNGNERRERIWFSPHCVKPGLFGDFF